MGNSGNCPTLFFGAPKSLQMVIAAMKLNQHLSAALSAPVSRLIITCQHVDQNLSAASLETVSQLISTCQLLDQHLKAAYTVPDSLLIIAFSAAGSMPTHLRISP